MKHSKLIRYPKSMQDDLTHLAAQESIQRGQYVSVEALIIEFIGMGIKKTKATPKVMRTVFPNAYDSKEEKGRPND